MSLITLIIDSVLLLGIIGVSLLGAATLPSEARWPLHLGPGGYGNWVPRNIGLLAGPAIGVAVYVILATSARSHQASSGHGLSLPVGLTIALAIMLANQFGALRAARNRGGRN